MHQQAADALEAQVAEFLRGGGAIARVDNLNLVVGVVAEDLPVAAPPRDPVFSEEFKAAHCGEFERLAEEWAPELAAVDLPELVSEVLGCVPVEPVCSCPSGDGSLRWPCAVHPPEAPVERREVDVLAELRAIRREAQLLLMVLDRAVARLNQ